MQRSSASSFAFQTACILTAVQIHFLNGNFAHLAVYLTEEENHQTDETFEDHLVVKCFVFFSVNSYISYFYIAFCWPFETLLDPFYIDMPAINALPGFLRANDTCAWLYHNCSWYDNATWDGPPSSYPTSVPSTPPSPHPTPANYTYVNGEPVQFTGFSEGRQAVDMLC